MKVFISWSGERSRDVAQALRDWLPRVIQALDPWMSQEDLGAGSRWSSEIANQLQDTKVGIICLTPENLREPWIHFEAGALSKTLANTLVCPYLLGVGFPDIAGPLVQFQAKSANKNGTLELMKTINGALETPLSPDDLQESFDVRWGKLDERLKVISTATRHKEAPRKDRELLEEILQIVRNQANIVADWADLGTTESNYRRQKGIRVNQLAKELRIAPTAILARLKAEGLGDAAPNHMSVISLGLSESIREWFPSRPVPNS